MRNIIVLTCFGVIFSVSIVWASSEDIYHCPSLPGRIRIDGELSDWTKMSSINLTYRTYPRSNLSASVRLGWQRDALYVAAEVEDDVFSQDYEGESLWLGDCLQLSFADFRDATEPAHELYFGLTKNGPQVWHSGGLNSDVELKVKRMNGGLLYEARIPWGVLSPIDPMKMSDCSFNVAVRDNDGVIWPGGSSYMVRGRPGDTIPTGLIPWVAGLMPARFSKAFGRLIFDGSTAPPAPTQPKEDKGEPEGVSFVDQPFLAKDFRVDATLRPEEKRLEATATLTVEYTDDKTREGARVAFLVYPGVEISAVRNADGEEIEYEYDTKSGRILVPWQKKQPHRITFVYQGIFDGRVSNRISPNNSWLLQESRWYPRLEAPTWNDTLNRGPVTLAISVPKGQVVVSAGQLVERKESETHTTFVWRSEEQPFGFSAANYEKLVEKVGDVEVRVWTYPEHRDGAREIAERIAEVMQFYTKAFGDYPRTHFAVAETDRRGGYGSLPLLINTRNFLGKADVGLLAHEIAHQWFGGAGAGMAPLHEGIATFLAAYFLDATGRQKFDPTSWRNAYIRVKGADKPISQLQASDPTYRAVTYGKAPYIFQMLRVYVGEDVFFEALRTYYARFSGKSSDFKDFRRVLEGVSKRDLSDFFALWLDGTELPNYTLKNYSIQQDADIFRVKFDLANEGQGETPVSVVLHAGDEIKQTKVTLKAGESKNLTFEVRSQPTKIEIDPGKDILQSDIEDDVLVIGEDGKPLPKISENKLPEEFAHLGEVVEGKTDETAIREIIDAYLSGKTNLAVARRVTDAELSQKFFYDLYARRPLPPNFAKVMAEQYYQRYKKISLSEWGMELEKSALIFAELSGQRVAELRVPRLNGRVSASFLFQRVGNQWKMINHDSSSGMWTIGKSQEEIDKQQAFETRLRELERLMKADPAQAIGKVEVEIKQNPSDPWGYIILGSIYFRQGAYDKAEKYLKKGIELKPEPKFYIADLHLMLGAAHHARGEMDKAKTEFEAVISMKEARPATVRKAKEMLKRMQPQEQPSKR